MGLSDGAAKNRPKAGRTALVIHAACAGLALLIVTSLAIVLDRSVTEADRFGLTAERKLVDGELQHQIDAVVQYQAELSFWDKTFAQLEDGTVDDAFVAEEMTEWLWADFGFRWMIFTDRAGNPILSVENGAKVGNGEGARTLKWTTDLLERADGLYNDNVHADGNGWRLSRPERDTDALRASIPEIHASDIRVVDGALSIVVVQAVVPNSLRIPASRHDPIFMVTVKPFTARMMNDMEARLGISHLEFSSVRDLAYGAIHVALGNCTEPSCMVAAWTPRRPGSFVRSETLPSVIVIGLFATLVMTFIALRFGSVVSALETSEAENRHQARHDRLTGLLNRAGFEQALAAAVLGVRERPFTLLCIDLDKFKAVNDNFGHPAGDALLKVLAERFATKVAGRGSIARLGGDEFAVILDHSVSRQEATALAQSLVIEAQIPVAFEGQLLFVGSSIGVAFAPDHGLTPREIVPAADRALYLAKNGGRNRVHVAEDGDAVCVLRDKTVTEVAA
ncbi:diguanylate cyclase (GGDEF)-like protein [Pararhizobium capsulatum DSM 1112]|uniref:Diguanylate cyclase (GGDEF)-like protein n=1 Tax=Pararhizobium capsulatum DSM 1112 TaxID=1121113 RepID=A0ABU0BQP1_9HYPH|nr:diguanylate cyclase [Pararhizobium capsulatum]MDQ0320565.1 diguanylate cyclase (GGDEF)-like protein [Pararhizobium capsulatum DSM 1112]